MPAKRKLPLYRKSVAGSLLAAREVVMSPIRPILRAAGVTEQQWRVLRVLIDEGAIDPSQLASSAILLPPSVTRILRELVERGLIQRALDPADGRRSIVSITQSGRNLFEHTAEQTLLLLETYNAAFGPERLAHLVDELSAFTQAIRALGLETPDSNEP
jgi:homoprotocatechuate degradation regulator HpaR